MLNEVLSRLPEIEEGTKVVSVLSGGLDSTIVTYTLVKKYGAENVVALSYNYGQKQSVELEKAILTCQKLGVVHKILDISFLGEVVSKVSALSRVGNVAMPTIEDVLGEPQPVTYVPYRNLILFSIGMSFAESNNASFVFNGLQAHDEYSYWDTTKAFVQSVNNVSELNRKNSVKIVSPFVEFSKKDEIQVGKELNVPWIDTWTCYEGDNGKGACGRCPSCSERIMNFAKAGIKDECPYAIDVPWDKLIEENSEV
jgi:7-cyano-7-deazaguanine synthase